MAKAKGTGFEKVSVYRDEGKALVCGINFDEVVGFYPKGPGVVFVLRGGGEVVAPAKWAERILGDGQKATPPRRGVDA